MNYDTLEQVLGKAASEYAAACKKHPVFPTRISPVLYGEMKKWLGQVRADNEGDAGNRFSVHSVQTEEALEALIEARRGNYKQAKLETLHLIATALRAYELYDSLAKAKGAKRRAKK